MLNRKELFGTFFTVLITSRWKLKCWFILRVGKLSSVICFIFILKMWNTWLLSNPITNKVVCLKCQICDHTNTVVFVKTGLSWVQQPTLQCNVYWCSEQCYHNKNRLKVKFLFTFCLVIPLLYCWLSKRGAIKLYLCLTWNSNWSSKDYSTFAFFQSWFTFFQSIYTADKKLLSSRLTCVPVPILSYNYNKKQTCTW